MIDELASRIRSVSFLREVPLSNHTSFGIGGPSTLFAEVADEAFLCELLKESSDMGVDVLVLGGGTNLLVSDDGFAGLTIKLKFGDINFGSENLTVRVGAGVKTAYLVDSLIEKGLKGLEFAAGLPGTIGGAIAGNAGCFGHALSDFLVGATVVDSSGKMETIHNMGWFGFDYRHSALSGGRAVITSAVFRLEKGDKAELKDAAQGYLDVREKKHPPRGALTAGSYFKNLPPLEPGGLRRAAGALLDQAGAHGLKVGDAAVFERHANIIINRGAASARDVLELASKMKTLVRDRFNVCLEEEVRFIGVRPEGI